MATNDISDFNSLNPYAKKKASSNSYDPETLVASQIFSKPTTHPLGIVSKALSGMIIGQKFGGMKALAQKQQENDYQQRRQVADILQADEAEGVDHDSTRRKLLRLYAEGKNQYAFQIAGKIPSSKASSKQKDPVSDFFKLAGDKAKYVRNTYGDQSLSNDAMKESISKDKNVQYFDMALKNMAQAAGLNFEEQGAGSFLSPEELANQNKLNGVGATAPTTPPITEDKPNDHNATMPWYKKMMESVQGMMPKPQPAKGDSVLMQSPEGTKARVPRALIDAYKKKGAKLV